MIRGYFNTLIGGEPDVYQHPMVNLVITDNPRGVPLHILRDNVPTLIDTGADFSAIDASFAKSIGLKPIPGESTSITGITGTESVPVYGLTIGFKENEADALVRQLDITASEATFVHNNHDLLIGMNVIRFFDISVSAVGGVSLRWVGV